jgi:hypothetical protein
MNLCAGWTIDTFVIVLLHFIAIVQPMLNHHLGRGAGEKDWAAHLSLYLVGVGVAVSFRPSPTLLSVSNRVFFHKTDSATALQRLAAIQKERHQWSAP